MPRSSPLPLEQQAEANLRRHDNYEELSMIGIGSYGTVFKARDRSNPNNIVALKKVRVPLSEDGVPFNTLREISVLKQLDQYEHPNIVRLLDICHGQTMEKEQQLVLYLVFEHVDQDLATYIERCPPPGLGSSRIKDIMFQILNGVDFLHSNRIVHRDLKPQNLLVTNGGNVKLADFGLAKTYDFEMKLTSVVVTLWYRSPEVLFGSSYATAVDIWSCGCIMAELFRRSPLFCGQSEADQLDKIFQVLGTPSEEDWPDNVTLSRNAFLKHFQTRLQDHVPEICSNGVDVLEKMLRFKPNDRISAADSLNHIYFSSSGYTPVSSAVPSYASLSPNPSLTPPSRTSQGSPVVSPRTTPISLSCSSSDSSDSGHSTEKCSVSAGCAEGGWSTDSTLQHKVK